MYKLILIIITSLLTFFSPNLLFPQQTESSPPPLDTDQRLLKSIDSLNVSLSSLNSEIDKFKKDQLKVDIEQAKENLELANRIIDWSSMFFTALAILLVIAGGIGLKEFSKIRQTEQNMKILLNNVKSELDEIGKHKVEIFNELNNMKKYRAEIIEETKNYMEISYYLHEGIQAYDAGDLFKSRVLLTKVINNSCTSDSDRITAHFFIGKSYYLEMEGTISKANENFKEILKIDPNNSLAYEGFAMCDLYKNKEKAIEHLKKAIELEPNNFRAMEGLGHIYRSINKLDIALQYYLEAQSNSNIGIFYTYRKEGLFSTSYFIGLIYYVLGDIKEKDKYFEEALYLANKQLDKFQHLHWAHFVIGVIKGLNNKFDEAKEHIEIALGHNSLKGVRYTMKEDLKFLLKYVKKDKNIKAMIPLFGDDI
ncbi:MAG: tetratricopeptide repeat protein [Candidatus Hodarchaeota archaeon]